MGFFSNRIVQPFRNLMGALASVRGDTTRRINPNERLFQYAINQSLYDNLVYEYYWEAIRQRCFPRSDPKSLVFGHFSPFKEIVEAYQNVWPGVWGDGMQIADQVDDKPVNPKLADPIRRIWRDSNLDSEKATIQRHAANFGTVGLRAVYYSDTRKTVVQCDHPARIFDVQEDSRGNVQQVTLKYQLPRNEGTNLEPNYRPVDIVEIISKDDFSRTEDGIETIADADRVNPYGFCPYVIMRHKNNGTVYGDWAYKGTETQVHAINYRISQQDRSIGRHQFPKWVFGAGGDQPKEVDIGSEKAIWIRLLKDSPTPFAQAIVPDIAQGDAQKFWMEQRDMVRGRQPKLTINDVRLFANISGETLMQVLKPAESAILAVRPNYDHALIRVLQMCLSIGAEAGKWDLGKGSGTNAGEKAYADGLENFAFASRPALPQTPAIVAEIAQATDAKAASRLALAKQAQGLGLPQSEVWRTAGYTDQQIEKMKTEKSEVDVIPDVQQ